MGISVELVSWLIDVIINQLINSDAFQDALANVIDKVVVIGFTIGGVLFVLNIAFNYYKHSVSKEGLDIKNMLPDIGRSAIMLFILSIYPLFISTVDVVMISIFTELKEEQFTTRSEDEVIEEYNNQKAEAATKMSSLSESNDISKTVVVAKNKVLSFFSDWKEIMNTDGITGKLEKALYHLVHRLVSLIAMVIEVVMFLIMWGQIQILKVIGPLALGFSVLGMFKDSWSRWFNAFVGGYAGLICIALIEMVLNSMHEVVLKMENVDVTALLVFDLVTIVLFLSAGKLGSYIVGTDSSSAVMNSTMAVARTVSNVYSAAKSYLKDNKDSVGSNDALG